MSNEPTNGMPPAAGPKPKTLELEGHRVTISCEPGDGRLPFRIRWIEDGQKRSEMFGSWEEAEIHAWGKLKAQASGLRTLSQKEFQDLLVFKSRFEALQKKVESRGRSLDSAISDLVAGMESLPGWRPTQMAEFLIENHLIKNPMIIERVAAAFMRYRRSGKERDFQQETLSYDEFRLKEFCGVFGKRYTHLVGGQEYLRYIMQYQVGPIGGHRRLPSFNSKLLRPASQSAKRGLFSLLNCMLLFAKTQLRALKPHSPTVLELLHRPQIVSPERQIYTPDELCAVVHVQPDIESMLYVSVQGFAGVEEGQARRLELKHIVLRSAGVEPHIVIEETGGFKDPLTGEVRTRDHKAPILPPLENLLAKVKRKLPRGRIFPTKSIRYKARRAAKEAGLRWIQGGLRNTFIANRLAEGNDLAEVAYESGIVFERDIKCFIGLAEESDARAYGRIKIEPGRRAYTSERIRWQAKGA